MMRIKVILAMLSLIIAGNIYGGGVPAGLFVNIPATARSTALGNAVAASNDLSNIIKTGGLLFERSGKGIVFTDAFMTYGRKYNFIGVKYGSYSIGYIRVGVDGIEEAGGSGNSTGTSFTASENYFSLSKTFFIKNKVSAAAGVSTYFNKIYDNHAYGVGTVLSIGYSLKNFKLAVSAHNLIATKFVWNTANKREDNLEQKIIFSSSFDKIRNLIILGDMQYIINYGKSTFGLGAEYSIKGKYFIRAGLRNDILSSGLGVKIDNFFIDYAFQAGTDELRLARTEQVNNEHKISIEYRF